MILLDRIVWDSAEGKVGVRDDVSTDMLRVSLEVPLTCAVTSCSFGDLGGGLCSDHCLPNHSPSCILDLSTL